MNHKDMINLIMSSKDNIQLDYQDIIGETIFDEYGQSLNDKEIICNKCNLPCSCDWHGRIDETIIQTFNHIIPCAGLAGIEILCPKCKKRLGIKCYLMA
jgi:hypothetical protein